MSMIKRALTSACAVMALTRCGVDAFAASKSQAFNSACKLQMSPDTTETTRREWMKHLSFTVSTGVASTLLSTTIQPSPAQASGGATAGGAYLLSAKQRYNERVLAGMTTYVKLESSLESGSLDEIKEFFASEEKGYWKDSSAAGYLLANAFRRSSSTPPDSLPSVKKWKAFVAELDVTQKALKKKDLKGIKKSYQNGEALLDAYLEQVELPPVIELRQ